MKLEEIVSVRDIRSVVKEQFKRYKDVKDQRVIDLLIFKGRQELETYLTLHKNRHHAVRSEGVALEGAAFRRAHSGGGFGERAGAA